MAMPEETIYRMILKIFYTFVPPLFFQMLEVVAAVANGVLEALGITGFGVTAL